VVLESAGQGERVAAMLGTASPAALSVPTTLRASLMARLDRLGPAAKEIAQIGAGLCHGKSIEHASRAKTRRASCRCDGILPLCGSFGSEDPSVDREMRCR
jgi:hypothetical protein